MLTFRPKKLNSGQIGNRITNLTEGQDREKETMSPRMDRLADINESPFNKAANRNQQRAARDWKKRHLKGSLS